MPQAEIETLPLFRMLPKHHLDEALELALLPFDVGQNEVLTVQGEVDTTLMIVVTGLLDVVVGDPATVVATVGPGELIGDMALFGQEGVRQATIRTRSPCTLLVIDQEGLKTLRAKENMLVTLLEAQALRTIGSRLRQMDFRITEFAEGTELEQETPAGLISRFKSWLVPTNPHPAQPPPSVLETLKATPALEGLSLEIMTALADELVMEPVPQGTILIQEGLRDGDAFILARGRIDVYRATCNASNQRVATLEPGLLFGVVALVHGSVRSASCYAAEPCWVVRLPGKLYSEMEKRDDLLARAFRSAVYEALVKQLTSANEHVAVLIQTLASSPLVTEREREAFKALVLQTS